MMIVQIQVHIKNRLQLIHVVRYLIVLYPSVAGYGEVDTGGELIGELPVQRRPDGEIRHMPWFCLIEGRIAEIFAIKAEFHFGGGLCRDFTMVGNQVDIVINSDKLILQWEQRIVHKEVIVLEYGVGNIGPETHRSTDAAFQTAVGNEVTATVFKADPWNDERILGKGIFITVFL